MSPRLAGKRVFLAEDEALVALDIEMTLSAEGCEVIGPVARLERALDLAGRETFDLAVLDVLLGRDEIYPLAAMLTERGVPFVFHSGHGDPAALNAAFPNAGFVRKPCSPLSLIEALGAVAEG